MAKYYLGIDVSKGYADFLLLDARKQAVEEGFQLDDTHQGHRRLGAYLSRFIQQHPDAVVYAAVESTGGYENNWYGCLRALGEDLPVQVARLNPAWVKFHHQACARCNKTDAISAREIAEFQIAHPEQIRYNEPEEYPMLRRQWNFLQLLLKQRTQLSNHLQALLYITMPELLPYCREGVPRWLLKVVEQYPTYQAMKAAGVIGLSEIPHLSARKAEALLARIEEGIGHSNETSGQLIATLAQQILALDGEIERQKKLLEQLLEQNCQEARDLVKLLCTFPGIGTYSAVGLLLNIGNIHRFPTAKHLASYAGVHPVYKQSGDGQWGIHMSKQGRAQLRAVLYMIALTASRVNPILKDLYQRCRSKGMCPMAALGVCMHKILRIVYGMLKHRTPFNPEMHRQPRQNSTEQAQPSQEYKKRRLQQFDENAPVSRRQFKQRQQQIAVNQNGIAQKANPKTSPHQSTMIKE